MTCRRFIYVGLLDRAPEIEELGCLHDPIEYLGHHRFVLDIERQGRATRTPRDRLQSGVFHGGNEHRTIRRNDEVSLFMGDTAFREALPNLVGPLRHLDEPRLETVEFVRSDTVNSQADHVRTSSISMVRVRKKPSPGSQLTG
jgi:hypothetical protein